MDPLANTITTAIFSVLACTGFWEFMRRKSEKKDLKTKMLLGLGHDRIISLCMCYISRKWITQAEYENLNDYLFKPYKAMGGNGSAERLMEEVNKLPIRPIEDAILEREVC